MSRSTLNYFFYILILGIFLGCDSDTVKPPDDTNNGTTYKIDFEFRVKNFRPLRDGEYYSLWIRESPDTAWKLASDTTFNRFPVQDSTIIFGRFYSKHHPDSIYEAMVTIELTKKPTSPSVSLLQGNISQRAGAMTMSHIGDFLNLGGGLTFTSLSDDTDAYKREFYLLQFVGTAVAPSLTDLPELAGGWRYGLWAVDYEFFPYHEFLYGLFDAASGPDADSEGDAYAYPGGAKKQRMDVASGRIVVTLEPPFYGDSLRYKGAELLTLLQFNRFAQIERDRFYRMSNVSGQWLPEAQIKFVLR